MLMRIDRIVGSDSCPLTSLSSRILGVPAVHGEVSSTFLALGRMECHGSGCGWEKWIGGGVAYSV